MTGKSNRGFASLDRAAQRKIASDGGKAAHKKGTAHEWDKETAREAGRKGGRKVSANREHMAAIGRKGGESRGRQKKEAAKPSVPPAEPGAEKSSPYELGRRPMSRDDFEDTYGFDPQMK